MIENDKAKQASQRALSFARSLIGTPYKWWSGGSLRGNHGPFWAHNDRPPPRQSIKSQGCSCAGLINLMRRHIGLPIPGLERKKYLFAGGTDCWFKYLKSIGVLKNFNGSSFYPKGTLLLRPYKNEVDQGHLAVVCSEHPAGVLYAKVIHAYPLAQIPRREGQVSGGIKVDLAVGMSHFWRPKGFYTHVCLPEDWLISDK